MPDKGRDEMELLSAYIDGELEESEKKRVASFLATSPEGKKALERLTQTKSLLMQVSPVKAPEDFLDALEAQAEEVQARFGKRLFWRRANPWAWASSFAAAALMVMAGVGFWPQRQIPFDVLVAAHMSFQANTSIHQRLIGAAHYVPPVAKDKNAGA